MPKIVDIYISRIVNTKEKKYGFAVTSDGLNAYIPARVVEDFDLTEDDLGTCNRVIIMEADDDRNGWHVATFVVEDSAIQQQNTILREEVELLKELLRENDIEF
jgi:ribosomal protein S1